MHRGLCAYVQYYSDHLASQARFNYVMDYGRPPLTHYERVHNGGTDFEFTNVTKIRGFNKNESLYPSQFEGHSLIEYDGFIPEANPSLGNSELNLLVNIVHDKLFLVKYAMLFNENQRQIQNG